MIFSNGRIFTGSDFINFGSVRIENGVIVSVSEQPCLFSEEESIDVSGKTIMPGYIDGHTHIGLIGDSVQFESDDINDITDPCTPHLRAIDGINPFDRCFEEAAEGGVTCVCTGPGSANPIGGQTALIETVGTRADKIVLRAPESIKFALGENPKTCYHERKQLPETRMGTAAVIRGALFKARNYMIEKERYESGNNEDSPDYDMKSEALCLLLKRVIPAHFHAHRADDIFTAVRIAKEFKLDYTVVHCTEGYLIADELADENVTAFVGPNLSDRSKPELRNMTFENPAKLYKAGVLFGITTDHPVIPVHYLPLCAALAVKSGLPYIEALKAITSNPARILKIDNRKGFIKAGADADLIICSTDPLDVQNKIEQVYIRGRRIK